MPTLADEIKEKATEYLKEIPELNGKTPPLMLVDFAIEKYSKHRNFNKNDSLKYKEDDIRQNINTIAMAVVELYAKIGAEGENSHSEKNIGRVYENAYISLSLFEDILPLAQPL